MSFPAQLLRSIESINQFLDQAIPPENSEPLPIHKAMRYSLFPGGKRFRPVLTVTAGEALGLDGSFVLPTACAIEMIHTYSLIHDDLPSMDNDDYRRGKPANHKVFGEAIAILAGDALLTHSFEQIAKSPYKPEIKARLVQQMSEAAGTTGMIGGQVMDMVNENQILSRAQLEQLHSMKTAALIRFAALSGAIIAEAEQSAENSFAEYGSCIGLAFQIVDDVLDIESTTEILGKTAGKDQHTKKVTYPSLIGLDQSKKLASDLIDKACESIKKYDRHSTLALLAKQVLSRKK